MFKISAIDDIVTENPRKITDGNKTHFCMNFHLKDVLRVEFIEVLLSTVDVKHATGHAF